MKRITHSTSHSIERLEFRIAPAAVSVSYLEIDGDRVTVTDTSGTLTNAHLEIVNGNLITLDLTDAGFQGASISFKVQRGPAGDGFADVGYINATGRDLGVVTIKGDLGQIDAGDADGVTPAIKSLSTVSFGRHGLFNQGPGASFQSDIVGDMGKLAVKTDLVGVRLLLTGGGDLGSVTIGGSLIGNDQTDGGKIEVAGTLGKLTIGGSIVGGSGAFGGHVTAEILGDVTIRGDLVGGNGGFTGMIFGNNGVGMVKIGGSVIGGGTTTGGGLGDNGFIQAGNGSIKSITIGGSLIGGRGDFSGAIAFSTGGGIIGTLGPVKIRGDVIGGTAFNSGTIFGYGTAVSVSIGGSLIGDSGAQSGFISGTAGIGQVTIGRDVIGGTNFFTGYIFTQGALGNVTIGGSIRGGPGFQTGGITSTGSVGIVSIRGDLVGGDIFGTQVTLNHSGVIETPSDIAGIKIGGSIIAGTDTSTGGFLHATGSIRSGGTIGFLTVGGSIIGNKNANGDTPVVISARGDLMTAQNTNTAIGKITVRGSVEHTLILAGYQNNVSAVETRVAAVNGDAQIGPVIVGGDWVASSLVAGAKDTDNDGFGDADDAAITLPASVGRITSIVIKGRVFGSEAAADHYGFVAPVIGSFKTAGLVAPLTSAPGELFELSRLTEDVTIREV